MASVERKAGKEVIGRAQAWWKPSKAPPPASGGRRGRAA